MSRLRLHTAGGGGIPGTYGPSGGSSAIRNDAGPQTVTDPGIGTYFTTADNATIAATIAAGPANSVYVFAAGTYNRTSVMNVGLKHPTLVFLPGAIWNGNGTDFDGIDCTDGGGFNVYGGKFQNFGTTTITSWVPGGLRLRGGGGTIQDVEFTNCHAGLNIHGSNATVSRCKIHGNFRLGGNCSGTGSSNVLVEQCEIYNNNTQNFNHGGHAGGWAKFVDNQLGAGAVTFRANWVHDNAGAGVWFDYWRHTSGQVVVEENVFDDNRYWGIFYEASYGNAVIQRNALYDNAFVVPNLPNNPEAPDWFRAVQMQSSNSDGSLGYGGGVLFTRNIIDGSQRAMGMVNHDYHPSNCKENSFTYNQVILRNPAQLGGDSVQFGAQVGGADLGATKDMWATTSENTFDYNDYQVASTDTKYWKADSAAAGGIPKTWAEWQALGFDVNGSRSLI